MALSMAPYKLIMEAIRADIAAGRLNPGDRIPSENELVAAHGVSRMTANRAVRELQFEGLVRRAAGSGSYVAKQRLELSLLRVPDIAEEIRAGGGHYASRVVDKRAGPAPDDVAAALELPRGALAFRTVIIHLSAGQPVQLEDRYVNPDFAPTYLDQDFEEMSPNAYLTAVARIDEAEQTVEAVPADARTARLLDVPRGASCLRLTRRTWARGMVATTATLLSPGDRWRLSVRFRP
jgi:GntR family transcriptional regulator, histidine utilization repressor